MHLPRSPIPTPCTQRLFALPFCDGSQLVLIGIANAVDLVPSFMPLLLKQGCAPTSVHFKPYTAVEIQELLQRRLAVAAPYRCGGSVGGCVCEGVCVRVCVCVCVCLCACM